MGKTGEEIIEEYRLQIEVEKKRTEGMTDEEKHNDFVERLSEDTFLKIKKLYQLRKRSLEMANRPFG